MLAAAQLEDTHLVVLAVAKHFGYYGCAGHQRSTYGQVVAITNGQNLVEGDFLAFVRSNLFYLDLVAGSNAILLAPGFYDCVHVEIPHEFCRRISTETGILLLFNPKGKY